MEIRKGGTGNPKGKKGGEKSEFFVGWESITLSFISSSEHFTQIRLSGKKMERLLQILVPVNTNQI